MLRFFIYLFFILSGNYYFSAKAYGFELVYVQSVSASKRSFVTRTGKDTGMYIGQQATFSSKDISLVAKATAVTREFTVWEVKDPNVKIPFQKNQVIEYNASLESIYYNLRVREEKVIARYDRENFLSLRGHFALTMAESVSSVPEQDITRYSNQFEGLFHLQFARYLWGGVGVRYDIEEIQGESFTAYSERIFALMELSFMFPRFRRLDARMYTTAGFGYGESASEVAAEISSGPAMILPYVRAGLYIPFSKRSIAFLGEVGAESISSSESFTDGTEQTTDMSNIKFGIGLSFTL